MYLPKGVFLYREGCKKEPVGKELANPTGAAEPLHRAQLSRYTLSCYLYHSLQIGVGASLKSRISQGEGTRGQHHGPRWDQSAARRCARTIPTSVSSVAVRRLQRQGQMQGVGGEGAGASGGDRAARAEAALRMVSPEGEEPDWDKLGARGLLPKPGFKVLPRRWVVERSFAWTGQNRTMSKDYERLPETGEVFSCT